MIGRFRERFSSKNERQPSRWYLLDGDAFGEVAGFVHVAAEFDRDMVGKELQRNDRKDRGEVVGAIRDQDHVVADFCEGRITFRSDGDDRAFTRFDFLDVADVFSNTASLGAMKIEGASSVMRAMTPCLSSALGYPEAEM